MRRSIIILIVVFLGSGAIVLLNSLVQRGPIDDEQTNENMAVLYKSPDCGCCVNYTSYLRKQGFKVKTVNQRNMSLIKNKYQIPENMESCHTTIINDYFVEGHVPVEAVKKLLEEKPAIDGIALPAMPAGSPGMPGFKRESFEIYQLSNGRAEEFITL